MFNTIRDKTYSCRMYEIFLAEWSAGEQGVVKTRVGKLRLVENPVIDVEIVDIFHVCSAKAVTGEWVKDKTFAQIGIKCVVIGDNPRSSDQPWS